MELYCVCWDITAQFNAMTVRPFGFFFFFPCIAAESEGTAISEQVEEDGGRARKPAAGGGEGACKDPRAFKGV